MTQGKIDKNKFMTLENTVDLLIDAVNQHYDVDRVLADFGVRILQRVNREDDIPGYPNGPYDGKFGDAYLVSQDSNNSPPYDIYIWTRKTPDSVEPDGYWLGIGELTAKGAQGIQGDPGPQGPQGENTRWYIYRTLPQTGDFKAGDVCLLPNGDVYIYVSPEYGWSNATQVNIKGQPGTPGADGQTPYIGPDGTWWVGIQSTGVRAEGRDGANGTPGTAILIQGKVSSASLLPDAATAPRNYGYLIEVDGTIRLYFIAGMEGEENWQYIEYSGNGTIVTTDGIAQSTWDTNTKVDKTNSSYKIYGTDENGNQATFGWGFGASANQFVRRTVGGNVIVPTTPTSNEFAASKKYVDDGLATKVSTTSEGYKVYGTDANGNQKVYTAQVQEGWGNDSIPLRTAYGNILVPENTGQGVQASYESRCAASKKYVDDAVAAAGGGDYEVGIVTKTVTGLPATLNVSDLVDIVPYTTVQINVNMDTSEAQGLPIYECKIGSTSVGLSSNQYYGFPVMNNSYDLYTCHVTCTGSLFKAVPLELEYGSQAIGTSFKCGQYYNGAGTNTLTATYIKHK